MPPSQPGWWKEAVCYQIWPASYKDSNGDGLGDIPGIIGTLDYLKDLGVELIWLSPMYASPQVDMGYDISDYENVYPPYGTLSDMETLIEELHARDMKLILDLVINHTSDQHLWFQESRKSKDNRYSDFYIWRAPRFVDGERKPPSNWCCNAPERSAWEYVPERGEYYLHLFTPQMPDLNWENPATRKAIYDSAIEFWLKKGVDGFRVDVVNFYSKDTNFPDAEVVDPSLPFQSGRKHYMNGPRMHEWLKEMRREVLDPYGEVVMVGELIRTEPKELLRYIGAAERELNTVFDFQIALLGRQSMLKDYEVDPHHLSEFKAAIQKTQALVPDTDAWPTVFLENHDLTRSIPRYTTNDPIYHSQAGKLLAILQCTLSGTLFLYQGQCIGQTNMPLEWIPKECKDVFWLNYLEDLKKKRPNDQESYDKLRKVLQQMGRDHARTPVQWDDSANAGFTTGKPWMRVLENYKTINVAAQVNDSKSIHSFWKHMIKLRKSHADLFNNGAFKIHNLENPATFTFTKSSDGKKQAVVVLNFTAESQPLDIPSSLSNNQLELLVSNNHELENDMKPWEGRVYLVK